MSDDKRIQLAIKKYLLKHPEFLGQHPELMTELEVVTPQGELTNLTTHQLRSLQKENQLLKTQMAQLIQNAQQNESLMNRMFDMLTHLAVAKQNDFLAGFVDFVAEHFQSDYFKLLVAENFLGGLEHPSLAALLPSHSQQFSVFSAKAEPMSGRLKKEKLDSVFGSDHQIKSAVVLPIGPQASYGMLAFGSLDEEKFHPNSSSDILQKLCLILETYFAQQPQDENQAMS